MPVSITEIGKLHYEISGDGSKLSNSVKKARQDTEGELDRLTKRFIVEVDRQVKAEEAGDKRRAAAARGRQRQIADDLAKQRKMWESHTAVLNNLQPTTFLGKLQKSMQGQTGNESTDALMGLLGVAGIGALAAVVGKAFVDVAGGIIRLGLQQAIEAGIQAASIERAMIALTAVTGSASQANKTLAEMIDMSRRVPGLQFESALIGATRLQTVGFSAEKATKLVEGLANVKLLSGSTNQDMDAVLLNFQQIRSYGKLTGDELRETLMRMPAMGRVFQDAFGTVNSSKIRDLQLSSDELFDRLTKAMENLPKVTGGATTAWEKLQNEIAIARTQFGTPLLAPITDELNRLTKFLGSNKTAWKDWGEGVANVLYGIQEVRDSLAGASASGDFLGDILTAQRIGAGVMTLGGSELFLYALRDIKDKFAAAGKERRRNAPAKGSWTEDWFGVSGDEAAVIRQKQLQAKDDEEVRLYKENTQRLETEMGLRLQANKLYADRRLAISITSAAYSHEAEMREMTVRNETENQLLEANLKFLEGFYAKRKAQSDKYVASFKPEDRQKVQVSENLLLSDLYQKAYAARTEMVAAKNRQEIAAEKAHISEMERVYKERYDVEQQAYSASIRLKQAYIQQTLVRFTETEIRQLEETYQVQQEAYAQQIESLTRFYDDRIALYVNDKEYAARLEQEKQREIKKIQDDAQLEQVRKDANTARLREQIAQRNAQQLIATYSTFSQQVSQAAGLFSLDNIQMFGADRLLSESKITRIVEAYREFDVKSKSLRDQMAKAKPSDLADLQEQYKGLRDIWKGISSMEQVIAPQAVRLYELVEKLKATKDPTLFDQIEMEALSAQQSLERAGLAVKLEEANRALEAVRVTGSRTEEVTAAQAAVTALEREMELLNMQFQADSLAVFSRQLPQLTASLKALETEGSVERLAAQTQARREMAKQRIQTASQIIAVEEQLAESSEDVARRIRLAHLQTAYEIKSKYEEAMIAIDRAQQQLADKTKYHHEQVMAAITTAIAEAPGLTQIFADAESGAIKDFFSVIDDGVAKFVDKLGLADTAFGNFIQTMLAGLAKLAASKLFEILFGVNSTTGQSSGGGGWLGRIIGMLIGALGGAVGGSLTAGGHAGTGGGSIVHELVHGGGIIATGIATPAGKPMLGGMPAALAGGGTSISPTFVFNANPQTGAFNQESAEQAARKLMAMQNKIARR